GASLSLTPPYDFLFAIGFATSRAKSMKICATGVRVRFFNVMIPTDPRVVGKSIGRALIALFQPRNFNANSGAMVRNGPVATRAMRATRLDVSTVARGSPSPAVRKASTASEPNAVSGGGSVQGSFTKSARPTLRRRDQEFSVAATTN